MCAKGLTAPAFRGACQTLTGHLSGPAASERQSPRKSGVHALARCAKMVRTPRLCMVMVDQDWQLIRLDASHVRTHPFDLYEGDEPYQLAIAR